MPGQKALKRIKNIPNLRPKDLYNYWINDGPKLVIIILFIICNIIVIGERFIHYYWVDTDPFHTLGWGLIFARCSAASIKLCCACILITVLRNFLSWLRGTWAGNYIPVDKAIVFHRRIAWIIAFMALVHVTAHMFNFKKMENTDPAELKTNLGLDSQPTALQSAFTTVAGTTGFVATACMILMYTTAVPSMRRPYFEAFWYTHHLFIIFIVMLSVHGAKALLEFPTFWCWIILPLLAYIIERTIRIVRGNQDTILQLAVQHPSKVVELQMKKAKFNYKAGQYLFLNCPYLASHEWHPFTITSAPEEDFVSVHIRIVGDWTGALYTLLNPDKQLGVIREDMLTAPNGSAILRIDGPFGAASEDVFKYEIVMLIGSGIGVTPFASILKTIRYQIEAQQATGEIKIPIQKVYFYWVAREKNAFEWFFELLSALESENVNDFLEIHAYLTAFKNKEEAEKVAGGEDDDDRDPFTGLKSGTHFGRPKWDDIFEEKSQQHPNTHIGVFFCGIPVMSKQLYKCARKFTKKSTSKFHYHKENF